MIEFNGKSYSGSVLQNDESRMIVNILTVDSLQDVCLALTGIKTITETKNDGSVVSYNVNNAVQVSSPFKDYYAITFSKQPTVIEELSNAVDSLLVMMLEG